VLVGVRRGRGCPPGADLGQMIAAVLAAPEIDATDHDQVAVGRIPGPDDVVVPALVAQVGCRVAVDVQARPATVGHTPVLGSPDLAVCGLDRGVHDRGVGCRVRQLDPPGPWSVRGGRPGHPAVPAEPRLGSVDRAGHGTRVVPGIEPDIPHGDVVHLGPDRPRRVRAPEYPGSRGGQHHVAKQRDGEAVDGVEVRGGRGRHLGPRGRIGRTEDAGSTEGVGVGKPLAGPRVDVRRLRGVHRNARAGQIGQEVVDRRPRATAVTRQPHAAARARRPHPGRIGGIHNDSPRPAPDVARTDPLPHG
jgi:hypothetical protein